MTAAEISAPSDLLVISLGAFGNKHAALYCALRDWLDRPIGWRIIPGARLLSAFEGDHNNALWRLAIEAVGLAAPYHKVVMAIERCQRSRYLLSILFYGGEVGYCVSFRDDVRRRRLELLAMNRPATSGADRNAGQNCQRQFEVRFHRFIFLGAGANMQLSRATWLAITR